MASAKTKTQSTLPVAKGHGQSAVPAFLATQGAQDAGKGVSTAQEDNLIPLIYMLQPLSPACNKRDPAYIEGAEPGAIWLRNAANPIVPGEDGILFQPCFFSKDWVEWIPRTSGGGYAGRHATKPADAKEVRDPQNPQKIKYVLPNGNELIETRYHAGFVITDAGPLPYVIPMASTAHTCSRQWMGIMNQKQVAGNKMPSWAGLYRLKTKQKSNAAGTWFTWDILDEGFVQTPEDYERGKTLFNAFSSGEKGYQEEAEAAGVPSGEEAM